MRKTPTEDNFCHRMPIPHSEEVAGLQAYRSGEQVVSVCASHRSGNVHSAGWKFSRKQHRRTINFLLASIHCVFIRTLQPSTGVRMDGPMASGRAAHPHFCSGALLLGGGGRRPAYSGSPLHVFVDSGHGEAVRTPTPTVTVAAAVALTQSAVLSAQNRAHPTGGPSKDSQHW